MKLFPIILSFVLIHVGVQAFGQDQKIARDTLTVAGVCGMCEERIENAAHAVKGVKVASWDKSSGRLALVYRTDKCSIDDIRKKILAAGHDVDNARADSSAYAGLPRCCQYHEVKVH